MDSWRNNTAVTTRTHRRPTRAYRHHPSVVLGIWISSAFLVSFSNGSFSFELSIRPVTIAVAALAMIVVAMLSLIPGVRSVKKLDVGAVVRERAT